jgi:hypothetical protein
MRRVIAVLVLSFLRGVPAAATEDFSLYSDACWHVEAGDLLGQRIGIMRLSDNPYVFFQEAGGDWSRPSIAKASADDLKRGKLVFTISDRGKPISFSGTINERMVTGRFEGLLDFKDKPLVVHLKRVPPAKRGVPNC